MFLELEAKRKLQVAHVARFARNLAELSSGRIEIGTIPVRVIEGVVCFSPELDKGPLSDRELLEQAEVPVVEARLVNRVADSVLYVESTGCWLREDLRSVCLRNSEPVCRIVRAAAVVRHVPDDLRSAVRSEEHTSELQSPCNLV